MGIEEDVSGILHEDRAIKVCPISVSAIPEDHVWEALTYQKSR